MGALLCVTGYSVRISTETTGVTGPGLLRSLASAGDRHCTVFTVRLISPFFPSLQPLVSGGPSEQQPKVSERCVPTHNFPRASPEAAPPWRVPLWDAVNNSSDAEASMNTEGGIAQPFNEGSGIASTYNVVSYPSHAYPETHPDRLAVIGILCGMDPVPVEGCRILEIGCGDGSNLIPIAVELPGSQCVGIDSAERPIQAAQSLIARAGVRNVTCEVMDLMDVTPTFGHFDYIIAHGFYSWVPEAVQQKLLSVCCSNLSPNGIAFISYNTYPGAYIRRASRDMMLFHLEQANQTLDRVRDGAVFLKFLTESMNNDSIGKSILNDELRRLRNRNENAIYHDELGTYYSPIYFRSFAAAAERCGLQFLAEAMLSDIIAPGPAPDILQQLGAMAGHDVIAYEQYLDFILFRGFRRTLLCHREIQLQRDALESRMAHLWVASPLTKPSRAGTAGHEFRSNRGPGTYTTKHPLMLKVLERLEAIWPHAERFSELLERTTKGLFPDVATEAAESLAPNLLRLAASSLVDLRSHRWRIAERISTMPIASPVERVQAAEGSIITTMLHTQLEIADERVRRFLMHVDGTRDRRALTQRILDDYPSTSPKSAEDQIDRTLQTFYKLGILMAESNFEGDVLESCPTSIR